MYGYLVELWGVRFSAVSLYINRVFKVSSDDFLFLARGFNMVAYWIDHHSAYVSAESGSDYSRHEMVDRNFRR